MTMTMTMMMYHYFPKSLATKKCGGYTDGDGQVEHDVGVFVVCSQTVQPSSHAINAHRHKHIYTNHRQT